MNTMMTNNKKAASGTNEYQHLLLLRIDKLVASLMPEFKDKAQAANALVLNDNELLELLYTTQLQQASRTPPRELRKLIKRTENLALFYQKLDELGGTIKVGDVADILGITRQAVNLRVKNGKLIAFKKNSDHAFPTFQFVTGGVLPGFEDVIKSLGDDISPVSQITFFTTPLKGSELKKTPLQIMKLGSSEEEMTLILRAASQVGQQIAS